MAVGVAGDVGAGGFDGVREEITPDGFVYELTVGVFDGGVTGRDGAMGTAVVVAYVGIRNEAASVAIRRFGFIDVDDGTVFVQAKQFPRSAVVVAGPAAIKDVAKTEEAIGGSGGGEGLPGFRLIARAAEHDDAIDALVNGEAGGGG